MHPPRLSLRSAALAVPAAVCAVLLLSSGTAYANVPLTNVSTDPFTDAQAQHRTEVEPDTFMSGSTIVSAFQTGRVFGGGSSDIGWATSTNGGATWMHGFLPRITGNTSPAGIYAQASDAAVAFDAKHNVWLISSLGIRSGSVDVLTSRSTDGGLNWSDPVTTATGQLDKNWIVCDNTSTSPFFGNCYTEYDITNSSDALPSAEIDSAGTAYVVWSDCRFRSGCPANDVVLSKSTSETTWGAVTRVPIDVTTSTLDHFVPGIGVDPGTSGGTARVGITYYAYPNRSCTATTCQLIVGFISSTNGGTSWSMPTQVAGPFALTSIPNTSQGRMFGDYISTSVRRGGNAFPVIPVANPPTGSTFDLAMYAPTNGLPIAGGARTATEPAAPAPAGSVPLTAH